MKSLLDQIFANKLRRRTNLDEVDVMFRRTTSRYAPKGTFSSNKSYLKVARNTDTGRFESVRNS